MRDLSNMLQSVFFRIIVLLPLSWGIGLYRIMKCIDTFIFLSFHWLLLNSSPVTIYADLVVRFIFLPLLCSTFFIYLSIASVVAFQGLVGTEIWMDKFLVNTYLTSGQEYFLQKHRFDIQIDDLCFKNIFAYGQLRLNEINAETWHGILPSRLSYAFTSDFLNRTLNTFKIAMNECAFFLSDAWAIINYIILISKNYCFIKYEVVFL